jgi:hypothetical protein
MRCYRHSASTVLSPATGPCRQPSTPHGWHSSCCSSCRRYLKTSQGHYPTGKTVMMIFSLYSMRLHNGSTMRRGCAKPYCLNPADHSQGRFPYAATSGHCSWLEHIPTRMALAGMAAAEAVNDSLTYLRYEDEDSGYWSSRPWAMAPLTTSHALQGQWH